MKDKFDDDFPRVSRAETKGRRQHKIRKYIQTAANSTDTPEDDLDIEELEIEETFEKIRHAVRRW